jgi:hypothetical protein
MNMNSKYYLLIIIIVVILFISLIYFIFLNGKNEDTIELESFRELARNVVCADLLNNLFLIDNEMVFWMVEGSCADASYKYTLFGKNPDEVLCREFDTIVGPNRECFNECYIEFFQKIIDNRYNNDLGSGLNNKVTKIIF